MKLHHTSSHAVASPAIGGTYEILLRDADIVLRRRTGRVWDTLDGRDGERGIAGWPSGVGPYIFRTEDGAWRSPVAHLLWE